MVDTHNESRSRVRSETPMEDLTMDQYTVEVCVLEVHPEKDVVHSLLMVKKRGSHQEGLWTLSHYNWTTP